MRGVARKYNLYPKARFNHTVKSIEWDESSKKWRVLVSDNANNNEEEEQQFDIM